MTTPDPGARALIRRTRLWMIALYLLGVAGFAFKEGARGALGFTLGAAASAISFWFLHRMAAGLEAAAHGRVSSPAKTALYSLRFLLIGGTLYAILRVYEVSLTAVAAGLFLTVAAITLANLYDWFFS